MDLKQPCEQAIRELAYEYWELRGRPIGTPEIDWHRAEIQLRSAINQPYFGSFETSVMHDTSYVRQLGHMVRDVCQLEH